MVGRTPEQAVDAELARLRRIAVCLTRRPLVASGYHLAPNPHHFSFAPLKEPVVLRAGQRQRSLLLSMAHEYVIERKVGDRGDYQVRTTCSAYEIQDEDGREFLAYHWHPLGV